MQANGSDFGKLATLQKELDENNEALLEKYERYEYLSELAWRKKKSLNVVPRKSFGTPYLGYLQCFSSCYLSIISIRIRKRGPDFIR